MLGSSGGRDRLIDCGMGGSVRQGVRMLGRRRFAIVALYYGDSDFGRGKILGASEA